MGANGKSGGTTNAATDLMNMLADDVSAVMNNRIDNALDHKETMVSKLRDGTMRSGWELE